MFHFKNNNGFCIISLKIHLICVLIVLLYIMDNCTIIPIPISLRPKFACFVITLKIMCIE